MSCKLRSLVSETEIFGIYKRIKLCHVDKLFRGTLCTEFSSQNQGCFLTPLPFMSVATTCQLFPEEPIPPARARTDESVGVPKKVGGRNPSEMSPSKCD